MNHKKGLGYRGEVNEMQTKRNKHNIKSEKKLL